MSNENIELFSSPDTWLLNLGYVSENSEQNLLLYGYISSRGVINVELMMDPANWLIKYAVVLDVRSYRRFKLQRWLEKKTGLFFKIMLYFFLKVFGNYNPAVRISRCVKDYAGKQWKTQVEITNVKQYNEITANRGAEGWFFEGRTSEGGEIYQAKGSTNPSSSGM